MNELGGKARLGTQIFEQRRYHIDVLIFVERGAGSRIWDVDGNEYIDYLLAYGPLILGHAHPVIVDAVQRQLSRGSVYGAPHRLEAEVAELLAEIYPSIDMVRYSSAGTEAVSVLSVNAEREPAR